jgi:hypothetical protein
MQKKVRLKTSEDTNRISVDSPEVCVANGGIGTLDMILAP